jgi:NodT family efflux transporter outer membrane factor (OMF) lipoprotein
MKDAPMRFARVSLTALICAAAAGCAVGPNYHRPSAPMAPAFKEAEGWSPAAPADALERGDWWTLFNDPVLNDLAARVQVSNQNIIAAEAAYRQARALVAEQRGALFPVIDLDGSGTRSGGGANNFNSTTNPNVSNNVGNGKTTSYRASLGATWEIDVWGRIRRAIEGAKANAQASEADLAAARLAAQGELAVDYFGLREADALVAIDQATVEGYQRTLQITQNRYNAGTIAHSDLLQEQTQVYNAQADLAGAQQQRATFEHAIAVLVGEAPGNFSLPAIQNWAPTLPAIPTQVPSTLLQRRPDIAGAERRMAAANAQIGVATAAFFPDLSLNAAYGFASSGLGSILEASNDIWSFGGAASELLFNGGTRVGQLKEARAAYDQTVAQYRQTVLAALQDVEDQLIATRILTTQYGLRQQASQAADAAEQMINNQYKAGQVSFVEVFTAQTSAYAARSALVQARAQRQSTAVALIQSLGGGWHAPEKK